MGIVWTTVYPSSDPHVVAPLVIGFFFLTCFALWERYGGVKYPLTPPHVFSSSFGRDFTAPAIALGICNMFFYSSSILWPTMISVWYSSSEDWKESVILSLPQGFAITFGAVLLSFIGNYLRNWQWQLTGSMLVMVLFGSLLALGNPTNKGLMIAFVFLSQSGYGYAICLTIAVAQMGVVQRDLGISGGIAGVFRFAAGSSKHPPVSSSEWFLLLTCCSWYCRIHQYPHQHPELPNCKTCSGRCYASRSS